MTSREAIRLLKKHGWFEVPAVGGHRQFKHPGRPNKVTIPYHKGELAPKTRESILKQAGLEA